MGGFYVCDMRPSWANNWAVTFWRPKNCGYAYPLPWSGKYSRDEAIKERDYYRTFEDGKLIRFPVPCEVVDAMAVDPPKGKIDGDAGPVVMNTARNRTKLRKAAFHWDGFAAPEAALADLRAKLDDFRACQGVVTVDAVPGCLHTP
jgi:hypothetical protein